MAMMRYTHLRKRLTQYSAILALTTCLVGCHADFMVFSIGWSRPSSLRTIENEWLNDRLEPLGVSLGSDSLIRHYRMHTNASGTLLVVWESYGDLFFWDRGDWSRRRYVVPFDSMKPAWVINSPGWIDDNGRIVARQEGAIVESSTGQRLDLSHLVKSEVFVDNAGRFLCVYDDVMKHVTVFEVNRLDRPLGKFVSSGPPRSLHLHRDRLIVISATRDTPFMNMANRNESGVFVLRFFRVERDVLVEDDPVIIPSRGVLTAIDPEADRAVIYKSHDLPFPDYLFMLNFRTGQSYRLQAHPHMFQFFVSRNVQGSSGAASASVVHDSFSAQY